MTAAVGFYVYTVMAWRTNGKKSALRDVLDSPI